MSDTERAWYDEAIRWGQTNLVEADPLRYDVDFWRHQWRRTKIQGVVVNCGGIAAYYPSEVPNHSWAPGIDQRDLFGEIVAAARAEGLRVLARMDSNRGDPSVFAARPDWFCRDAEGRPMMRGDKHATCISSSYYDEFIPAVLTEAAIRYAPDGFADNGWAGIDRSRICHCDNCARSFGSWAGADLPMAPDWTSAEYRAWIRWNYARRTELWENNNQATKAAGGSRCLWLGMLHGELVHNANVFQDVAAIAARTPVVLLDHQRRHGAEGFEQNAEVAKRVHSVLGEDRFVLECTAMYDMGYPAFRLSSMPAAEVALWLTHGWAGGTQPWWHHIGSVHEDTRQYESPVPWFTWHHDHAARLLTDRELVADVGVVWSQENLDFYGQSDPTGRVMAPYAGINRVLTTQNLLFTPVHVDKVAEARVKVLVLPDVAVLTDEQCDAIRGFVERGGALLATGDTSLRDADGFERADFALADLLGAHATPHRLGGLDKPRASIEFWDRHSYLRLDDGHADHPVLDGLEGTRTMSFGGGLREVVAEPDRVVPLTWVPPFPIFPPEIAWMRTPRTTVPALILGQQAGGRVAFLPADLDRCAHREEQPDHAHVLGNVVRWLLADDPTVRVTASAPVAVNLYRTADGYIVHLNSLLYDSKVPGRQARITPYGPITVEVRACNQPIASAHGHVAGQDLAVGHDGQWTSFTVPMLEVHEVVSLQGSPR